MITVKCDVPGCNREFTSATQFQANRSLGFHKAKIHGIPGKYNRNRKKDSKPDAEGKYRCKYCSKTFSHLQVLGSHVRLEHQDIKREEKKKAYMKKWREDHKNKAPLTPEETQHRRELQKTAWWTVESEPQPIKLDRCPCCGARFMAVKSSE